MTVIKINDKYYRECSIVMLPTDKAENCIIQTLLTNKLAFNPTFLTQSYLKSGVRRSLHLYIISNEDIKEGDWVYRSDLDVVFQANLVTDSFITMLNLIGAEGVMIKYCKKIIATTDPELTIDKRHYIHALAPTLHLPCIPNDFITHYINGYNRGNVLNEAFVLHKGIIQSTTYEGEMPESYELIVNEFNEITALILKQNYSTEDIVNIFSPMLNKEYIYKLLNNYK